MGFLGNRLLKTPIGWLLLLGILILVGAAADSAVRARYPESDIGKDSLSSRQKAHMEAAKQF